MKKLCIFILIFFIIPWVSASACSSYGGASKKDKEIAQQFCDAYAGNEDIIRIEVESTLLHMQISQSLYTALSENKLGTRIIIGELLKTMKRLAGSEIASVWLYVRDIKVITGDSALFGGNDKITFLVE